MSEVKLHIYDVGTDQSINQMNQVLAAVGTGAFHGAVEVYGMEWSYGYSRSDSGVFSCKPKQCQLHTYRESIKIGDTKMTKKEVEKLLVQMRKEWKGVDYDLLRHNCCSFSNDFCQRLGVGPIPAWITNLAGAGATLTDGVISAVSHVQAAAIIAKAKAGEIDMKYDIKGPFVASAQDFLKATEGLDKQYRIRETVGGAVLAAGAKAGAAGASVISLIQQGPEGVRIIAFAAGVVSSALSVIEIILGLNTSHFDKTLIPRLVLHVYVVLFALTTMIFEAKPEWIQKVKGLDMYQNMLLEHAKFISQAMGRGLFYGFQATLWLGFGNFKSPIKALPDILLGLWFFLLALYHVGMHFGITPMDVAAKIRKTGQAGYQLLQETGSAVPMSKWEEEHTNSAGAQKKQKAGAES